MTKSLPLIMATMLALSPLAATAQTPATGATPATARRIDLKSMSPEALEAFLKESFKRADRNGDGFIDAQEAPEKRITRTKNGQTASEASGKDLWIADYDQNKDKKVSWEEFRDFTTSLAKRAPR
ncbi:MAG: EF-hand domain-containing protein [Caulobacter sp.]